MDNHYINISYGTTKELFYELLDHLELSTRLDLSLVADIGLPRTTIWELRKMLNLLYRCERCQEIGDTTRCLDCEKRYDDGCICDQCSGCSGRSRRYGESIECCSCGKEYCKDCAEIFPNMICDCCAGVTYL